MRLLLTLAAIGSLAACSHNQANVHTGPQTGRAATDTTKTTGRAEGTDTTKVSGTAEGTATGTVNTSGDTAQASGSAQGTATVDTATEHHDSL